jgi:PTS system nitrogen regulatory IIA component
MDISALLTPQRIRCGVAASSKKRALEALSALLAASDDHPSEQVIFEELTQRERLGSTGLGDGVALPHSRSPEISQPRAALVRLAEPVKFDAADGHPVDLLIALLVPSQSNASHPQTLAALAEQFRDPALTQRLRACQSDDDLYAVACQPYSQANE